MTKLSPSVAWSRSQVRALIVDDDPYQLEPVSDQAKDVLHAGALVAKLRRFSLWGLAPKPVEMSALSSLLPPCQT